LFTHTDALGLPQGVVPRQVETVINHREISRQQFIAGVSGGVMIAPADVLATVTTTSDGALMRARGVAKPPFDEAQDKQADVSAWWWDGPSN
jgi:hypothetical protein